jgi:DNA-binding XRE family transcriptional regulator
MIDVGHLKGAGYPMHSKEFRQVRCFLDKTQNQLAQLLAVSPKAVQSFEQGWRRIPPYIERQMLLLLSLKRSAERNIQPCWDLKNCPRKWRENCIIWELKAGNFCWAMNGTFCHGQIQKSWDKKIQLCQECEIYKSMLPSL